MTTKNGFTLIEMMMTVAISSVVITGAVSVFIAMANQQRMGERLVEAQSSAMMGGAMVQSDVVNAGYRLPGPAFALRYVDNVAAATSVASNGGPITTLANCGSASGRLVPGSDVLEVATGLREPGVISAGGVTPLGSDYQVRLVPVTGGVPPFTDADVAGGGLNSVLLFADKLNNTCLGKVGSFSGNDPVVTMLDRSYAAVATPATYYPSCPTPGMSVYRLAGRVRYMVCAAPGATPDQYGLYRQTAGPDGAWQAPFGTLQQDGIEDLQVSGRYSNATGTIAPLGTAASCVQGSSSASSICYCDDQLPPSCTLPPAQLEPVLAAITSSSMVTLIRGVKVQLTGVSVRPATASGGAASPAWRRPDSFNHPGMTAANADRYLRVQQQFTFNLNNFQVVP